MLCGARWPLTVEGGLRFGDLRLLQASRWTIVLVFPSVRAADGRFHDSSTSEGMARGDNLPPRAKFLEGGLAIGIFTSCMLVSS